MRKTFWFVAVAYRVEALVDCQFIQNVLHSSEQYSHKVSLADIVLWLGETKYNMAFLNFLGATDLFLHNTNLPHTFMHHQRHQCCYVYSNQSVIRIDNRRKT